MACSGESGMPPWTGLVDTLHIKNIYANLFNEAISPS